MTNLKKSAFRFVILIGVVSLFADMTYEGARSITGPYLAILGANAVVVGFVAGFGELIGYALRVVSGFIAERTGQYWVLTILGYICNLFAVPLLALADQWWIAALLMIIERMGKAIRVPPRDAMLSHAGQEMGMGWMFGLHEALDQTGAMLGPLIVSAVLYFKGTYQSSFALLLIPALLAIAVLFTARFAYPVPYKLEVSQETLEPKGLKGTFWIYAIGASLVASGYADFPLIAYHFQKTSLITPVWIPISYAFAMGVNTISAPLLGYLYDRKGFSILIWVTLFSAPFAAFVFLGDFSTAIIGVLLWSIGVGAHESLMRAIVANMISKKKRSSAYGVFNGIYGVFWFLGSILLGYLYDISIPDLVIFSIVIQLLGIPLLLRIRKHVNHYRRREGDSNR